MLPIILALLCANAFAQSIDDGLLLRLNFAGDATDSGPFALKTTVTGATLISDARGKANHAYAFNGTTDKITVAQSNGLELTFPLSVSAWIYLDDSSKAFPIFANDMSSTVYSGIIMTVSQSKLSVTIGNGAGAGEQFRSTLEYQTLFRSKMWYHVACVVNGIGNIELYVNGAKVTGNYTGSGTSMAYTQSGAAIGFNYSRSAAPSQYAKGKIDNVRYYGRALSALEIKILKDMVLMHSMDDTKDLGPYANVSSGTDLTQTKNRFGNTGKATAFNGSSSKWTYPSNNTYKINFPITVSTWVKPDQISGNRVILNLSDHENSKYAGIQVLLQEGIPYINLGDNVGSGAQYRKSYQIADTLKVGNWYNIVAECSSFGVFKIYINGVEKKTGVVSGNSTSMAYSNAPGYLGYSSNPFGSPFYFNGSLDDLMLLNGVLTAQDVSDMFKPGIYFDINPNGKDATVGTTVTLNSHAVGTGDTKYQWQKKNGNNWVDISTQKLENLIYPSVNYSDSGLYRCIASSSGVKDTSSEAFIKVENSTQIKERGLTNIEIYPNPCTDQIALTGLKSNTQITITDGTGKIILQIQTKLGNVTLPMPANMAAGAYWVTAENESEKISWQIIKN